MKRYVLVLTSILVLFVGLSSVLASISLPPSDPGNNPPGPSISFEQIRKMKACEETYKRSLERCTEFVIGERVAFHFTDPECVKRAQRAYHECIEGILNPPQLILPNSNSPGQGN